MKIYKQEEKEKGVTENNVDKKEWRIYFMKLLEGREENEKESGAKMGMQGQEEEELGEEEIGEAVIKIKQKKTAGIDGIPAETRRFGEEAIKKGLTEVLRDIWKEGCTSEEWKTSIIVPFT